MEQLSPQVYAAERLKAGVTPDVIKQHLMLVGWREDEADNAIMTGLIASGVPVPPKGARSGSGKLSSTVEVVLNFFSFITLGAVAAALVTLYYQIINNYFPDPLIIRYGGFDVSMETIHYAIAALIITFPIYAFSVQMWFKRFREDEEKTETRLTKWLTYLVLLVSAITIVGDLVTALFYLLQGEVTGRFFLKSLTILVVAGIIFGFYFLERKKIQYRKNVPRRTFQALGWATLALVLVAVILGFVVGGSPSMSRKTGFDTQRANDLRSIAGCVANFGANQQRLPETLDELSQSGQYSYCAGSVVDPESGMPYDYRVVVPSEITAGVREGEFELCANFALTSDNGTGVNSYSSPNDKWSVHGTGQNCDTERANLERYTESLAPSGLTEPTALPVRKIK
jgi:hypothetical protein